ncbi:hypothetical protein [Okeania sp.]|uniref:hypothetical protein n=1 Tax=Okeania sp. TaxID=3100323 RepID=UPI002B4B7D77|nr:hypothetical protein [Okeania sp.]MEB3343196.1 hypothetical protein [Okeania sp.]
MFCNEIRLNVASVKQHNPPLMLGFVPQPNLRRSLKVKQHNPPLMLGFVPQPNLRRSLK